MPKAKAKPKPGLYWFLPFGKNSQWRVGELGSTGLWWEVGNGLPYATAADWEPIPTVEELRGRATTPKG